MTSLNAIKRWIVRVASPGMLTVAVAAAACGVVQAEDGGAPINALRAPKSVTYHEDAAVQQAAYVPRHQRHADRQTVIYQDPAPAPTAADRSGPPTRNAPTRSAAPKGGPVQYEAVPGEIIYEDGAHWGGAPVADCDCGGGGCDSCVSGPACATNCCLIPCPSLDNVEVFGGVHGFTGPVNRGEAGSFGFHEGVNWAAPVPCFDCLGLGAQVGARFTHSNFSGTAFTDDVRNQTFVTAGLFRRVDWGLQGGVVVDYLNEDWYLDADLMQLRGEVSWVFPECYELGFWFNTSLEEDDVVSTLDINGLVSTLDENLQSTDVYAFFYRHRFDSCESVVGRVFAGFTGESDGLIGSDLRIALTDSLALSTGFSYLVPEESNDTGGYIGESWNVATTLVWYPGCRSARGRDYYRPLFDVAGNGSFFVDRNAAAAP